MNERDQPAQCEWQGHSLPMRKRSTRELFTYWNDLRGARSAPERRDIDPTRIRHALANTFILEATDDGDFKFRLAGSHLCSAYCRELKGRSFTRLWHARDRDAIETLIKAVTDDHAVALVTFSGSGRQADQVSFETILLPLRHNGATNNRIIGAITAMEEPYWLGMHPILEQRISGLRLIWPDDPNADLPAQDLAARIDAEMGHDAQVILGDPPDAGRPGTGRYAHLSVIEGGKP